jgi:phenylacetate-CoA ligase
MIKDTCIDSGITKNDVVQICMGYGMFTGGLGFHEGLSEIGCSIIPVSSGNTEKQIFYLINLNTTVLMTSPSYAMHMYEVSQKLGIDLTKTSLRMIKVGSELLTDKMREKLKECYGDNVIINQDYGMTESMGPGLGNECKFCSGLHIYEKNFIYELIDPVTKQPTNENIGELVITTLNNECFPLIRYATNDIVELEESKCHCGNSSAKIKRIIGRTDDMIKIKGVKVYLSQVENFILSYNYCSVNYEVVLTTKDYIDNMKIRIEYNHKLVYNLRNIFKKQMFLEKKFKEIFGIKVDIELLEPETLPVRKGKVKRIKDLRNKYIVQKI